MIDDVVAHVPDAQDRYEAASAIIREIRRRLDAASVPDDLHKQCVLCGFLKPSSDFHRDNTRHDGRHPYCRECRLSNDTEAGGLGH